MGLTVNAEIRDELNSLVNRCRDTCLWFIRTDCSLETEQEIMVILENIEKYGDREAFIRARKIKKWLLQNSSGLSAE